MNIKKILTATAASTLLCTAFTAVPMTVCAEPMPMPGDPNADTGINIADATAVLEHYARTSAGMAGTLVDNFGIVGGDVDGNRRIDISDATLILEYFSKTSAGFNVDNEAFFPVYALRSAVLDGYKEIVTDFLGQANAGSEPGEGLAYELACIDEDFIPELILSPNTTSYCTLYTHLNGEPLLMGNTFGSSGALPYLHTNDPTQHGTGIIFTEGVNDDYSWMKIQYLKNANLTTLVDFTRANITGEFTMNGAPATKEEVVAVLIDYSKSMITAGRAWTTLDEFTWYSYT